MKIKFDMLLDKPNKNHRVYPKEVMRKAIREYNKVIEKKRSFGECYSNELNCEIDIKKVSHLVTDIKIVDDEVVCGINLLTTPHGKMVKELFESNVKLGLMPRGFGNIKNGVVSDYTLVSVDFVSDVKEDKFMNRNGANK